MQMQTLSVQGIYPNLMEVHCIPIETRHQQFFKNQIRTGIKCRLVGKVIALNAAIHFHHFIN